MSRPIGSYDSVTHKVRIPGPEPLQASCPECKHTFEVTPGGPVRIHVVLSTDKSGKLAESFVHNAPTGTRALTNALCRLVSHALQGGTPIQEVVKMLRSQHESYPPVFWPGKGSVVSLPDALGRLLEERIPEEPVQEPELGRNEAPEPDYVGNKEEALPDTPPTHVVISSRPRSQNEWAVKTRNQRTGMLCTTTASILDPEVAAWEKLKPGDLVTFPDLLPASALAPVAGEEGGSTK